MLPKTTVAQQIDTVVTSIPKDTSKTAISLTTDSIAKPDSLTTDSTKKVRLSENAIKSDVKYVAKDSISFDLESKTVKMYNTAQVNYEQIELKAAHISYGFQDNQVYATSLPDTANLPYGKPIFSDNGQTYDSDTIRYNFKTKKGAIKGVYTKLNNDGHIYGKLVKKDSNDVLWIKYGQFCPCEDKDAKTRIHVRRIKVIPHDKIVTGAGYLTVGKIPTPLVFPFGYFPNQDKATAGILIPSYGESASLGFFLQNGGYYQPLGSKADLELRGDIYSKGAYALRAESEYRSNYKHQGSLGLTYNVSKNSYKELQDYSENRNYFLRWNHAQDAKARPNTTFSANVNIGSGQTFRNNINTSLTDYVTNTFNSGIVYGKSWDGKPYNLGINVTHSQNTQTRDFSLSLPSASFNLSRVFLPLSFLKSKANPTEQWFEKIGFNYTSNFNNRLNTKEPQLRFDNAGNLVKDFKNGIEHKATLSTSFKALHLSINPAISYGEKWYFDRQHRYYNEETGVFGTQEEHSFFRIHQYSFNLNFSTQLFGMFTASRGKIAAVRHMMSPTVGFFYQPEFDYKKSVANNQPSGYTLYDPYEGSVFGTFGGRKSAGLNFGLNNNLEMKVRTPKDTAQQFKKIKLIDRYALSASYDVLKDSVKWSPITMNAGTVLFQKLTVQYNGTYSPYNYSDTANNIFYNQSLLKARGKLLRMLNSSLTFGLSVGQIKDQKIEKRKPGEKFKLSRILPAGIPVTLNANYNLNLIREINSNRHDTLIMTQSLTGSGDIQLLRRLRVGYNSGYDFKLKELTPTTLSIYWDLNCWELTATYIPFGFRKSYSIRLNMKSALLKDLKLERKRNLSTQGDLFLN